MGGGGASPYPTASFSGGELRLQGGFDATTPSGAHRPRPAPCDNAPLSSLKTLSYDFRIIKRPAGNSVIAPTIHVTVLKANTGTPSGFTNFVFEPYMQGDFGLNQRYSLDALSGKWWATRTAGGINQSNPADLGRGHRQEPGRHHQRDQLRQRRAPRATRSRPTSSPPASTT